MIHTLRKRFILFSVLVISSIMFITALFIFVGGESNLPVHRYVITLSLAVFMTFVGSLILSKVAIRPIQSAWQKQLDFTADASHELRTPITVIQTNLDLIIDNDKETVKSQMKWLKNIDAENKRMAKLVDDLLTLSRSDTDEQMLKREIFMLDKVVFKSVATFESLANVKSIALNANVNSNTTLNADKKRIEQLLAILLDNAIKYTDSGSVTVTLTQREKDIQLIVTDTGRGIESEHLDKIFDRFYRTTQARQLNQGGSGLGLSIAKWIVSEHGGHIHVTSTVGSGTSFAVHLPI